MSDVIATDLPRPVFEEHYLLFLFTGLDGFASLVLVSGSHADKGDACDQKVDPPESVLPVYCRQSDNALDK